MAKKENDNSNSDSSSNRIFEELKETAVPYANQKERLSNLAQKAFSKSKKHQQKQDLPKRFFDNLFGFIRMIKAYSKGNYKGVEKKNLYLVIAAILYFLMPLDLIPDFIPGLGFLDDIAVLGWLMKTVGDELSKFKAFEDSLIEIEEME